MESSRRGDQRFYLWAQR